MTETVVLDRAFGETRLAVVDKDERLVEIFHFRAEQPSPVGEIHLARLRALAPAFGGAFVATAFGEAFLKAPPKRLPPEGSTVAVRIRSEPGGGKLPIAALIPREHYADVPDSAAPILLFREPLPWVPMLRAGVARYGRIVTDAPDILAGLKELAFELPELSDRIVFDRKPQPIMQRLGLEDEIAALLSPVSALGQGATVTVEETRALTAVDVDASGLGAGRDERATARAVNTRAVAEIARQLRLRRLGGVVVVDFLRLAGAADRVHLAAAVHEALLAAGLRAERGGFTRLGLLEFKIAREGRSLATEIADPVHPGHFNAPTAARRALRAGILTAAAAPGRPVIVAAHPDLAACIEALDAGAEFLGLAGAPLAIERDSALDPGAFTTYLRTRG